MSIYGLKKILTIDKGADLSEFITAFKKAGIDVTREENIKTALTISEEIKPDAILFV